MDDKCKFDAAKSLEDCIDDIKYLAEQINKHHDQIDDLIALISNQVDLFDKRRNKTIGFFIAVYVPLAFATVRGPTLTHGDVIILLTLKVFLWYEHRRQIQPSELDQHHISGVRLDSK